MIEAFLHINIAQSLFSCFVIIKKKALSPADKVVMLWLLAVIGVFVIKINNPESIRFKLDGWVLQGLIIQTFPVFLYLYTRFLVSKDTSFRLRDSFHFSISLISVVVLGLLRSKTTFLKKELSLIHDSSFIVLSVGCALAFILYGVATYRLLSVEGDNVKMLKRFALSFYLFYAIVLVWAMGRYYFEWTWQIRYFSIPMYTGFIYGISLLRNKKSIESTKTDLSSKVKSYLNSGLKSEDAPGYVEKIIKCMDEEKPWLNSNVTIKDIAKLTSIPSHFVTQILNEELNKNFYTLVNEYRVNEVIRLFDSADYENKTIEWIAYEAGFNSKSSFNVFFKKSKGETPSVYRRKMKNS
ncbi:AraC family transcriptional regulator [Puteibacter caeruleilacunae]|nr:AraC family transcriptional regulator [Puteibacter caeruleilacunae]